MNPLFKIPALLMAVSIMTAPYLSLLSHAVVHQLFVFEHQHFHQYQAVGSHDHEQDHDHAVTTDTLSLAPIVSMVKPPFSSIQPAPDSAIFFKSFALRSRLDSRVFKDSSPPFSHELSIYFLLHPTNAPPLR